MAKKKKIKRITSNPLPKYLTAPTLCQGIRERASNLDEIYDLVNRYVRILDVVRNPAEPPEKVENTLRDKIRQMREQKIIPIEPPSPDSRDLRVWLDWMQRIRLESENTIGDSNDGKTKRKTEPEKIELPENSEQSKTDDIKNRFTFTESQAFFDGKDINLPTGSEIVPAQILKQLVESFGIVVSYKTLDENSDVTASDFLRGKIKQINNALKTHKVPCKIESRTWFGYFLSHSRNRS